MGVGGGVENDPQKNIRMSWPIVENVRTSSDIVFITSRGPQLPYRKKNKTSVFPITIVILYYYCNIIIVLSSYLTIVILSYYCHLILLLSSYLAIVILSYYCHLILLLSSYLTIVILSYYCHLILLLSYYLTIVILSYYCKY